MKSMLRITTPTFVVLVLACLVAGVLVYPHLPERVVTHWNAAGQPDGTGSRFWSVFLMPVMLAVLFLLYWIIPRIDPLRANIARFRLAYDAFWMAVAAFIAYVYALTLAWNVGIRFPFVTALIPALAALWWLMGWMMGRAKRNWFVGIRTPWTLADDRVWDATHRLGARLFKWSALVILAALLLPAKMVWVILIVSLGLALFLIVYSYVVWRRLQ